MKKMTVLRTILSVTLAAFLLCGCGNSTEEVPVAEVPEVTAEEEVVGEPEKEEEEVAEEPTEETSTEMPEAQVTTVADITEFAQYMANVDPKTPHVVVWNEAEGYLIDIKDGEYYQIKEGDRIFESWNAGVDAIWSTIPEKSHTGMAEAFEITPDYTKFDDNHECIYGIYLKENPDTPIYITYYLDAPAE